MEPSDLVRVDLDGPVCRVTLDHPPVNALNPDLLRSLSATLEDLDKRAHIRAIVLTGAGRTFVAGADISAFQGADSLEMEEVARAGNDLYNWIERSDMVFVAAINGVCLGGGNELALACDIRLAAESARFGQPEINLGLIPGWGALQRLPRVVGRGRALELCLSGAMVGASQALAMGLASEVLPDGELLTRAAQVAHQMAGQAPLAVAQIKSRMVMGQNEHMTHAIAGDARAFAQMFATEDAREGIAAFLQKRKPAWQGR